MNVKKVFSSIKNQKVADTGSCIFAFGKHPGWDDHIDGIGSSTRNMLKVRDAIYVEGIRNNVDTGRWSETADENLMDEFCHHFFWRFNDKIVAGKMWTSSDGKGRRNYPMVCCVECGADTFRLFFDDILEIIGEFEQECRQTVEASVVAEVFEEAKVKIGNLNKNSITDTYNCDLEIETIVCRAMEDWKRREEEELDGIENFSKKLCYKVLRVLYGLCGDGDVIFKQGHLMFEPIDTGIRDLKSLWIDYANKSLDAEIVSVFKSCILLWMEILEQMFGVETPTLIISPQDKDWLDVLVGKPSPSDFYCLKADLGALPLTSDIPFNLNDFINKLLNCFKKDRGKLS